MSEQFAKSEKDVVVESEQQKPMPHVMPRCPACGAPESLVWVHGHGQCAHCHMNVMPCCDGETCETD